MSSLELSGLADLKIGKLRLGELPDGIRDGGLWLPAAVPGTTDISGEMHGLVRVERHLSKVYIHM
jgi:hypothetical protein